MSAIMKYGIEGRNLVVEHYLEHDADTGVPLWKPMRAYCSRFISRHMDYLKTEWPPYEGEWVEVSMNTAEVIK